jgi:hypothetical protein
MAQEAAGRGVGPPSLERCMTRTVVSRPAARSVEASCYALAVVVLLAGCGSPREGSHLSKSDPTAYPTLKDAVRHDTRYEAVLFQKARRCAAVNDYEVRASGCATEVSKFAIAAIAETATVADLVDESAATSECRETILRLRQAEEDFSSIGLQLEVALSNPSPRAGLEEGRGRWLSVKAARHNALLQCR